MPAGQTTLDGARPQSSHMSDPMMAEGTMKVDEDGTLSPEEHINNAVAAQPANGTGATNGNSGLVFEHYAPNGDRNPEEVDDVEMT